MGSKPQVMQLPVHENTLLLKHIFSYLGFKDLSSCRLTSKLWFEISFPFWMEKGPVLHLCQNPAETSIKHHGSISDILEQVHNSSRHHSEFEFRGLRKYKKIAFLFDAALGEPRNLLDPFMASAGNWITQLGLKKLSFGDLKTFEDVLYCKYTPSLEMLFVMHCDFKFEAKLAGTAEPMSLNENYNRRSETRIKNMCLRFKDDGPLPVAWDEFLHHYPQLKTLELSVLQKNEVWKIFMAITKIRKADKEKLALTEFNLHDATRDHNHEPRLLLDYYAKLQLPLENLDIHGGSDITPDHVYTLLELHSTTVTSLRIFNEHAFWVSLAPTLTLENLHHLEIGGPVFNSFKFLQKFPNLESLILKPTADFFDTKVDRRKLIVLTSENDMRSVELVSLKDFQYNLPEICGLAEINKIKSWMPNLRSLVIPVTEEGLVGVCSLWPFMESIDVSIGLTGDANIREDSKLTKNVAVHIPQSITKLKNLQTARLGAYKHTPGTHRQLMPQNVADLKFDGGKCLQLVEKTCCRSYFLGDKNCDDPRIVNTEPVRQHRKKGKNRRIKAC